MNRTWKLTLHRSLIVTVKETIFKAQVYNDSEKSRVKQHKIFRDYLSVTANLKFAVSFLCACHFCVRVIFVCVL